MRDEAILVAASEIFSFVRSNSIPLLLATVLGCVFGVCVEVVKPPIYWSEFEFGLRGGEVNPANDIKVIKEGLAQAFSDPGAAELAAKSLLAALAPAEADTENLARSKEIARNYLKSRFANSMEAPFDEAEVESGLSRYLESALLRYVRQEKVAPWEKPFLAPDFNTSQTVQLRVWLDVKGASLAFIVAGAQAINSVLAEHNNRQLALRRSARDQMAKEATENFKKAHLAYSEIQTSLNTMRAELRVAIYKLDSEILALEDRSGIAKTMKDRKAKFLNEPSLLLQLNNETAVGQLETIEQLELNSLFQRVARLASAGVIDEAALSVYVKRLNEIEARKSNLESLLEGPRRAFVASQEALTETLRAANSPIDTTTFALPLIDIARSRSALERRASLDQERPQKLLFGAMGGVVGLLTGVAGVFFISLYRGRILEAARGEN